MFARLFVMYDFQQHCCVTCTVHYYIVFPDFHRTEQAMTHIFTV